MMGLPEARHPRVGGRAAATVILGTLVAAAGLSASGAGTADPHPAPSPVPEVTVDRLAWMAGCWEGTLASGSIYEEVWSAPRGGTLVGMSRTIRGAATVGWESLRIEEDGGGLVYVAVPSGQRLTRFRAIEVSSTSVTFENPEHDFPQRILYRQPSPTRLVARIEGSRDGEIRAIEFPLERVPCPG